jgi:hypothetical protein
MPYVMRVEVSTAAGRREAVCRTAGDNHNRAFHTVCKRIYSQHVNEDVEVKLIRAEHWSGGVKVNEWVRS